MGPSAFTEYRFFTKLSALNKLNKKSDKFQKPLVCASQGGKAHGHVEKKAPMFIFQMNTKQKQSETQVVVKTVKQELKRKNMKTSLKKGRKSK